jgi:hypothetical protein
MDPGGRPKTHRSLLTFSVETAIFRSILALQLLSQGKSNVTIFKNNGITVLKGVFG